MVHSDMYCKYCMKFHSSYTGFDWAWKVNTSVLMKHMKIKMYWCYAFSLLSSEYPVFIVPLPSNLCCCYFSQRACFYLIVLRYFIQPSAFWPCKSFPNTVRLMWMETLVKWPMWLTCLMQWLKLFRGHHWKLKISGVLNCLSYTTSDDFQPSRTPNCVYPCSGH